MKYIWRGAALGSVGLCCVACQRFPSAGNSANFTAITFSFSVASQIDTTDPYIYDVAIRPVFDSAYGTSVTSSMDPKYAPIPTIDSSNPNGRMNGSPTRFIEFRPGSDPEFTIFRFALATEDPPKYDPTNPVNLGSYAATIKRGIVFNPQSPLDGGDPSTLSFTVHTNELVDSDTDAEHIVALQINIIAMTRPSNLGSGARILDGLGDSSTIAGLTNYLAIDTRTSNVYDNSSHFEPTGDTFDTSGQGRYDPAVDLVNYTITVAQP